MVLYILVLGIGMIIGALANDKLSHALDKSIFKALRQGKDVLIAFNDEAILLQMQQDGKVKAIMGFIDTEVRHGSRQDS